MRRITSASLGVCIALLALAVPAGAKEGAPDFWAPVGGPYQGPVKCLVAAEGTLYAGTLDGVFISKDQGKKWTAVPHTGMADKIVTGIAVTPAGVFAAGAREITYGCVSKLSPDGKSWTDISGNLRTDRVQFGVLGGIVSNAGGDLFVGSAKGLYRLPAGGKTWEAAGEPEAVNCLVKDSTGCLLAGTDRAGVQYSTDQGKTWTKVSLGGGGADTVFALTVDAAGQVWAGTRAGLWLSKDHGATWTNKALPKLPVSAVAVDGQNILAGISELRAHTVSYFGGLQRSTDGGATFKPVTPGVAPGVTPGVTPGVAPGVTPGLEGMGQVWSIWTSGQTVIIGASGAYVSADGGATFAPANEGLLASNWVRDIAFKPDGTAFASTPTGMYRSKDLGQTWTRLVQGLGNLQCFKIVVTSKDRPGGDKAGVILVGVWSVGNGYSGNGSSRIFRSTDDGAHWTDATPDWTYSKVGTKMRALMENSRGEILAGAQFTGNGGTIWRSIDSGRSFQPLTISPDRLGGLFALGMNPVAPDELYLTVELGDPPLFRSTDHGATWTHPASTRYPKADPGGFGWTRDGKTMFVGNVHGNFSSTDKGENWSRCSLPGTCMAFATAADGTMYGADMYHGVYRSTDEGKTWEICNSGMGTNGGAEANLWCQCLQIAPDGYLWVGTQDALYRSIKPVQTPPAP